MKSFVFVFIGGGLGSALRYYFSILINANSIKWVPTLSVNILGCLLLGFLLALNQKEAITTQWYLVLGIGFCGGLTTFSTFSAELFHLFKSGDYIQAILYFLGSAILGIAAVALAHAATLKWS